MNMLMMMLDHLLIVTDYIFAIMSKLKLWVCNKEFFVHRCGILQSTVYQFYKVWTYHDCKVMNDLDFDVNNIHC